MEIICPTCHKHSDVPPEMQETTCSCGYHFSEDEIELVRSLEEEFLPAPKNEKDRWESVSEEAESLSGPLETFEEFQQIPETEPETPPPPYRIRLENVRQKEQQKILQAIEAAGISIESSDIKNQLKEGYVEIPSVSEAEAIKLADRVKDLHCDLLFGFPEEEIRAKIKEKPEAEGRAEKREREEQAGEASPSFAITTGDLLPGFEIREYLGILTAECVLKEEVVLDVLSAKTGVGSKYYGEAISNLERELKEQAILKGANGVIAVSFTTSILPVELEGPALVILAAGTAVKLRRQ